MRIRYQSSGRIYEVELEHEGSAIRASVDGQPVEFELLDTQPGQIALRLGERPVTVYWAADGNSIWASLDGCTYKLEKPSSRRAGATGEAAGGETVRAPMPAQVRAVQVDSGDAVEKGQTLLLLEAMKMEIRVRAPSAGRVSRILVSAGQAVDKEQVLVEIIE